MGTTSVVGQAVGTAAALCGRYGLSPRGLYEAGHIDELQQALLCDGCYIPGIVNADEADLARHARLTASSGGAAPLCSGVARPVGDAGNAWCAEPGDTRPVLEIALAAPAPVTRVLLTFDSDLNIDPMITMDPPCARNYRKTPPPSLMRDYTVELVRNGAPVAVRMERESCIRNAVLAFAPTECDTVRVTLERTWGGDVFRLFEARVYADKQ